AVDTRAHEPCGARDTALEVVDARWLEIGPCLVVASILVEPRDRIRLLASAYRCDEVVATLLRFRGRAPARPGQRQCRRGHGCFLQEVPSPGCSLAVSHLEPPEVTGLTCL